MKGILTDRECGALRLADEMELDSALFDEPTNEGFSNCVLGYSKKNGIDYLITIFSRLLVGDLLSEYEGRIFNLHPSILPALPGLHSFDRAVKIGCRFIGETIHVVDDSVDGGPILQQCAIPHCYEDSRKTRHRLFVAECKMLLQLVAWLSEDRIEYCRGRAFVKGAGFEDPTFSPALEDETAMSFDIPFEKDLGAGRLKKTRR